MKIEILSTEIKVPFLISECKEIYPDLKIDETKPLDFKRLLKKLIRDRNILLKISNIRFQFTCPIFIYYDIRSIIPCHWNINVQPSISDDISFETGSDFNSADEAQLMTLLKKIKSISLTVDKEKLKYFLPMSTHISFRMVLDILQVYEFLARLSGKLSIDSKMKEFYYLLMKTLTDNNSVFFNDQLLDVYKSTKEF